MSTIQAVYAALQQEGYQPRIGEGGILTFKYYGQEGRFRAKQVGPVSIGELECRVPRPVPTPDQARAFMDAHPLSRLSGQEGQALLSLETLLGERDIAGHVRQMLALLDQYAADLVFARPATGLPEEERPAVAELGKGVPVLGGPAPATLPHAEPPVSPSFTPPAEPQDALPAQPPRDWEELWLLMSARYHPLARALAAQGVPAPDEVQMDMMQGQQVRGTAIMMWGAPPNAVVVCEPGQPVPQGYQGSTWLKHLTVEQVAQETRAHLQAAGRL